MVHQTNGFLLINRCDEEGVGPRVDRIAAGPPERLQLELVVVKNLQVDIQSLRLFDGPRNAVINQLPILSGLEIGNDGDDGEVLPTRQYGGVYIWFIAYFIDNIEDFLAGFLRDALAVVQHTVHGPDRHPGRSRDLLHRCCLIRFNHSLRLDKFRLKM